MVQVDTYKYLSAYKGYVWAEGIPLHEEMSTNGSLISLVKTNLQYDPGFSRSLVCLIFQICGPGIGKFP